MCDWMFKLFAFPDPTELRSPSIGGLYEANGLNGIIGVPQVTMLEPLCGDPKAPTSLLLGKQGFFGAEEVELHVTRARDS